MESSWADMEQGAGDWVSTRDMEANTHRGPTSLIIRERKFRLRSTCRRSACR
jgi:hypothetical protein